jgi:hypothetical protein
MSNLLYGYDSDNGTFTPLPPSPLLIPLTILYFLGASIYNAYLQRPKEIDIPLDTLKINAKRWDYLKNLEKQRELSPHEKLELTNLEYAHGDLWPLDYSELL